ncbi:AlpA family phage regulatory protein [uncultured Brevundimonas sp.]|uniref:helix-turn-helix transcriptional regulator n=1 Tax=uncultured Brevundimonas sp. TaxID=213418 RepID=UPI0034592BC2
MEPGRFLRVDQVSERVGRSPRQIYRLIARGEFPRQHRQSYKVSVWYESEIAAWQVDQMAKDLLR